jgi:hypothetical protein
MFYILAAAVGAFGLAALVVSVRTLTDG